MLFRQILRGYHFICQTHQKQVSNRAQPFCYVKKLNIFPTAIKNPFEMNGIKYWIFFRVEGTFMSID